MNTTAATRIATDLASTRSFAFLMLVTPLAAACANSEPDQFAVDRGVRVDAVWDQDLEFNQYQTFAFRDDAEVNDGMLSDLNAAQQAALERINEESAKELEELGLRQTSPEEADILAFSLAQSSGERVLVWDCVPGVWGGYWYWSGVHDPCAWVHASGVHVENTTAIAGLVDPELERVVFVGFVHGLDRQGVDLNRQIEFGMERIFDRYPGMPFDGDVGASPEILRDPGTAGAGPAR